jgi:type III secretion protein W
MSDMIQQRLAGQQVNVTLEAMKEAAAEETAELRTEQQTSQASFMKEVEDASNPFASKMAQKQKKVESPKTRIQKMLASGEKAARLLPIEQIKDMAGQFQKRNPEMKASVLTLLRQYIKPGDTKEEILKKILEFYSDPSLADEALEFLLETTDGELFKQCQEAKDELQQNKGREIAAGRNIGVQARSASEKGLGTPTELRDLYRDITGNPRDSGTLFDELSRKYAFKDLKKVTDFLLHSLGADMKSKGPSIEPGQLHRLIAETRSLQAILGVYRFFRLRMRLVNSQFARHGLEVPHELSFETLSKEFMALISERYPNADKVKERAVRLGIKDWIIAKIIALSQFRDAIREVAMNQIFRSLQHRDDLYMAILEALEDLEDELDEEEEKEGEEEGEEEEEKEEK